MKKNKSHGCWFFVFTCFKGPPKPWPTLRHIEELDAVFLLGSRPFGSTMLQQQHLRMTAALDFVWVFQNMGLSEKREDGRKLSFGGYTPFPNKPICDPFNFQITRCAQFLQVMKRRSQFFHLADVIPREEAGVQRLGCWIIGALRLSRPFLS